MPTWMSFEVEDLAARLGALEDTRYLEFLRVPGSIIVSTPRFLDIHSTSD